MTANKFLALVPFLISTSAFAGLMDLKMSRGEQMIPFAKNEVCVIPRKFPNINASEQNKSNYSDKDREHELELCHMDFYAQTPVEKNVSTHYAAGVCPKLHNTNPGLEIYEIPAGKTRQTLESEICDMASESRNASKIAKYKLSTSCSYTPSILAYYHVSRIMGDLLQVPPAVLRTMDAESYKAIPQKGKKTLSKGGTIAATWKGIINQLNNPTTDKRGPYLFTSDNLQTFGGLMKNAKGESAWLEISNHAGGEQIPRGQAFMKEDVYSDLINPAVASNIVGTHFNQANLQRLRLMGDAADMLVMDFMLRQEDRFNNIAYTLEVSGQIIDENGGFDIKSVDVKKSANPLSAEELKTLSPAKIEARKLEIAKAQAALEKATAEFNSKYPNVANFPIRRIMLKDNDCGVAVEAGIARVGIAEKLKMLESVRHMKKSTYDQLQRFNVYLSAYTAQSKEYFMRETMMTSKDYNQFALNVKRLADGMKTLCQSQKLHLDLGTDLHFSKTYKAGADNCVVK